MSQNQNPDTKPVITTVPETEIEKAEAVEKLSFVAKTKQFAVAHKPTKKTLFAGGALVGLVGLAAVTGRKTAPSYDFEPIALEFPEEDVVVGEVVEVQETETETA
jgi:hypothetical protein